MGDHEVDEVFPLVTAGMVAWAIVAFWIAVPVGFLRGPRAARAVFAVLMNPLGALIGLGLRALIGRLGGVGAPPPPRNPGRGADYNPRAPPPPPGFGYLRGNP